ncbi:MAG: peptidoglycan editing factor PgeF [Mediterranea sp.]|jgi:YfiH family protein|nr:peptidoglycan editing factor PgeF [Mediterranea sp.]
MTPLTADRRMLGYDLMRAYPDISCFTTTRHGGVGEGAYATFNCSHYCGDSPEHVRRNRQLLLEALPGPAPELVVPTQTHGTRTLRLTPDFRALTPERKAERLQGIDALLTDQPGYCLCVSTADCVPILLYDPEHQAIAAVHAGWRGTVADILGHVLEEMRLAYGTAGDRLLACIGPSISIAAFEVGDEVYEAFHAAGFDTTRVSCRNAATGKRHIDLWEANRMRLADFGVPDERIELAGICTYNNPDDFFSARRLGIRSGRMLSGITHL